MWLGPKEAANFLTLLAKATQFSEIEIDLQIGIQALSSYPRWAEVEIVVPFGTPCTAQDLNTAPMLRGIIVPSLGYEGVDVLAATQAGVVVANGHVAENFESVAEAVIMLALMSLYDIRATEQRLHEGQIRTGAPVARMMRGRTIGVIGFGNIGRAVATRLQNWGATWLPVLPASGDAR